MHQPDSLQIGAVLAGRYELLGVLGQGGYGTVYKARQHPSGQPVAIKLLHTHKLVTTSDATREVARFEREMQLIAHLKHPNIVRLIDTGRLDDGRLFTVLEFVDGLSLHDLLRSPDAPAPVDAIRLMIQVLEALHCAHTHGAVHRDLKPANIMVTRAGRRLSALVLDFGIASLVEERRGADYKALTQTGQLHGTPSYMPPEQLEGHLTPQSDLYAWGLVLLECLLGHPVVDGDSLASIIFQQLSEDPIPLPPSLRGAPLGRIIARAVAKPLDLRARSADQLLAELERHDLAVLAAPASALAPPHARTATASNPALIALASTASAPRLSASAPRADARPLTTNDPAWPHSDAPRDPRDQATTPLAAPRPLRRWRIFLLFTLAALLGASATLLISSRLTNPAASTDPAACPPGQRTSPDTYGHCCWPGQAWNNHACVGIPEACPRGYQVDAEAQRCRPLPCDRGRVRSTDGAHCCWPGQAWSAERHRCIGLPDCPQGSLRHAQTCVRLDPPAWRAHLACEARQLHACAELGARLLNGDGAEHRPALALDLLARACDAHIPDACARLGLHALLSPSPDAPAVARARVLLERACDDNAPSACFQLAIGHPAGLPRPPDPDAARLLARACDAGDPAACDLLGVRLRDGWRAPADPAAAARLFARACDLGLPAACTHQALLALGAPTATPIPPPSPDTPTPAAPDVLRAARLLERACDASDPLACARLANLRAHDRPGLPADPARADAHAARACRLPIWFPSCP